MKNSCYCEFYFQRSGIIFKGPNNTLILKPTKGNMLAKSLANVRSKSSNQSVEQKACKIFKQPFQVCFPFSPALSIPFFPPPLIPFFPTKLRSDVRVIESIPQYDERPFASRSKNFFFFHFFFSFLFFSVPLEYIRSSEHV